MRGNGFSEEDRLLAKELLEQGHSIRFVAGTLGRAKSVVRRWVTRLALDSTRRPWSEADKEACREMHDRGMKIPEIADAMKRSADSVAAVLSAMSRRPTPPKAPPRVPPAPRAREPYVAWMVAQEKLRRRVDRSVNTA